MASSSNFGCPHCGQSNPLDARFCAYCGTNLQELDPGTLPGGPGVAGEDSSAGDKEGRPPGQTRPSPRAGPGRRRGDSPDHTQRASEDSEKDGGQPRRSFSDPAPPENRQDRPAEDTSASSTPAYPGDGFLSGLRGAVPPLDASSLQAQTVPERSSESSLTLDNKIRGQLRQLFESEIPISDLPFTPQDHETGGAGSGLKQRAWIGWLVLFVLVASLLWGDAASSTRPHTWPGVNAAYSRVESLPAGATVLINWAYDPAMAGELDRAAMPVIEHLLQKEVQLVIFSQLPGGPATARRLVVRAGENLQPGGRLRIMDVSLTEGGFLPGGASTLPLLAQAPALGLPADMGGRVPPQRIRSRPDLAIVMAGRSESVQRWLEQVQPLNDVPTLAVTSAAADPPLRPYLDSGQLSGLVSGYSGGIAYREYMGRPTQRDEQTRLWQQITGHDWALVALLVVVVLGNMSSQNFPRAPRPLGPSPPWNESTQGQSAQDQSPRNQSARSHASYSRGTKI